jgi:hypothetical protein
MTRHSAVVLGIATTLSFTLSLPNPLRATENSGSVYPVGAETVLPGTTPAAHATMLSEFSTFYEANRMNDSTGASALPEFKVRVTAHAVKVVHNWGLPVLGGLLNSNIAVPIAYEKLHTAAGIYSKTGLSNIVLGVFQVGYQKNDWHWYYEGDLDFPGAPYTKGDAVNIGQHNYAVGPVGGFTYLPHGGAWEASSKFQYLINFHNPDTHYRSGNEFIWEYDAMHSFTHRLALGVNGYLYQQTTDDYQNGAIAGDGNRGRDLTVGPEARIQMTDHLLIAVKYFRETLVENRPSGNAFWFELATPLHFGRTRR